jgi:dTDP-4-amino-4,6-dideoxygalactose transaminase
LARVYLSPPDVNGVDRHLLIEAVDSNWVAPVGPDLDAFEAEVAAQCGRRFGVGLASGTAALHLALLELGVRPGDEVIVSSFTFAATANAVRYCGATPVLVDADEDTWQVSAELVAEAVKQRRRAGACITGAIVVDLYGQCADYDDLLPLFRESSIPVVEDAAEALGATYRGRPAGSFGDAAILSFNGNKIITTSGGGSLVTDEERLADRCRHLATQARSPAPHYEHSEVGFNYRLSNLLAAFGRGQLSDLDRRVRRRRDINRRYQDALAGVEGVAFMPEASYGTSTCWLTCITIDPSTSGAEREEVRLRLEADDIESRPVWKPMHLQPAYRAAPAVTDGTSERLFRTGLCLPSGSSLSDDEQTKVIGALLAALSA